jgi:L,D-transpeptidase YcbB
MKWTFYCAVIFCLLFYRCKEPVSIHTQAIPRDTTINYATSFSDVFFDSLAMEKFISTQQFHDSLVKGMRNFYNARNYQYAWFFKEGIAEHAPAFYDVYNDYLGYSGDSTLKSRMLQLMYDSIRNGNFLFNIRDSIVLNTELLLTAQFFRYSRRAYQGSNQLNAHELSWFIPRKKIDPSALLDSLLFHKGKDLADYEPVNRQYNLLKNYLLKYYELQKNEKEEVIIAEKKNYKKGDISALLPVIKKKLFLLGDMIDKDTSNIFTSSLEDAVKNFQERNGLKADGIMNSSFFSELKKTNEDRIQQILINMERIRWVPAQPTTDYLLVNIPEFRLHVYEMGDYRWSTRVVVGTAANNTVIFSGTLKHVVFSPYWNVPSSILKNEILPAIARNKNYLARNNMEWYDGSVRQRPGPGNALGKVKFLFPNSYNIYLHDTPSKSLFNEERRTFSHGCIRVSEPMKLAQFLLRNDANWDSLRIAKAMNARKEQYYNLEEHIPVYIGYFTAWVDRNGKLNFRNDVYGHDKKMKARLFTKQ